MAKLHSACYAVRTVKAIQAQETLRIIYFSYIHSIMTYFIIFWGNSPYNCWDPKKDNQNYYKFKKYRLLYGTV